jgi:hypothetical protein
MFTTTSTSGTICRFGLAGRAESALARSPAVPGTSPSVGSRASTTGSSPAMPRAISTAVSAPVARRSPKIVRVADQDMRRTSFGGRVVRAPDWSVPK